MSRSGGGGDGSGGLADRAAHAVASVLALVGPYLGKYRPTEEEGGEHTGFASTLAEVHSLAIGAGFGLAGASAAQPAVMATLVLTAAGAKGGRSGERGGRMRDVVKEPAYAVGAMVAVYAAYGFLFDPAAIQQAGQLLDAAGASGMVDAATDAAAP